jgi:hypothetical protein
MIVSSPDYETEDRDYLRTKQNDDEYWAERARRGRLKGMSEEQQRNNPNAEPMGHFTGRCGKCGSNDLWDDNLHYGCNSCGAMLA